ncbi:MAG: hypothetical protein V1779_16325 [bacterium]
MKNRWLEIVLLIILSFFITNCNDTTKPIVKPDNTDTTLTQNYNIFYPLSQSDGWRPEHSGLFFYSYKDSQEPDRILTESIVHISSVGRNGTIVFQYEYHPEKFWVRYTDGTTLPIPFPQLDQSERDYFYTIPPHIELSGDGKKAVFFATIKRLDGTKPEENNLVLIIVNLPEATFNIYEMNQFILNNFSSDNVNFGEVYGKDFLVNEDASQVTFVMKGRNFYNGQFSDIGYYIIGLNNSSLSNLIAKSSETIKLLGVDENSQKFFAYFGSDLKVVKNGSLQNTNFTSGNMSNPHQFVSTKSEVVLWTDFGISIFNSGTEEKVSDVISWDSLKTIYPDIKNMVRSNKLSISPDGGMIVFGFDKNTDPVSYDLFAIRRNGKDLRRLVPNTPIGIPVVSWGMK